MTTLQDGNHTSANAVVRAALVRVKRSLHVAAVALSVVAVSLGAVDGWAYPSRPIRIVVPGAAGGVLDIGVRKIVEKLSRSLGQPVIVDNKPGANGFIAAESVARSKPDGHTLLLGGSSHLSVNQSLFQRMPYDPIKDFEPITLAAWGQPMLLVDPSLPIRSVKDLIAYAKAHPGKVAYGSPSVGSPNHLAMELFQQLTNVEMVHVPYKVQPQIMTDLIGGQIQVTVEYPSLAGPHIRAGKVRAIAVVGEPRKPAFPDVPTSAEVGLPEFVISGWYGYLVPAGTPKAIIARLNKELNVALQSKEFVEFIESVGSVVKAGTAEEFARYIRSEQAHWAKVIKQARIRID